MHDPVVAAEAVDGMADSIDEHLHAARSYLSVISGYTQLVYRAHLTRSEDMADTVRRTAAVLRAVERLTATLNALEQAVQRTEHEGHPP